MPFAQQLAAELWFCQCHVSRCRGLSAYRSEISQWDPTPRPTDNRSSVTNAFPASSSPACAYCMLVYIWVQYEWVRYKWSEQFGLVQPGSAVAVPSGLAQETSCRLANQRCTKEPMTKTVHPNVGHTDTCHRTLPLLPNVVVAAATAVGAGACLCLAWHLMTANSDIR